MIGRIAPTAFERDAAPGIHRVTDSYVNWYLLEDETGLTIVDCGLPRSWALLHDALRELGRTPDDLRAVVLTHAHWDHVGFARRAQEELGLPIYAAPEEAELAQHPYRYDWERNPLLYMWIPAAIPIVAGLTVAGAYKVRGVTPGRTFADGDRLDVPGNPLVVSTPGHTHGHCALHVEAADAVIAGDAIVMLDPYTGKRGPRLVARAATADVERATRSLDAIAATDAAVVLTGHGEPYRGGAGQAATEARIAGAA